MSKLSKPTGDSKSEVGQPHPSSLAKSTQHTNRPVQAEDGEPTSLVYFATELSSTDTLSHSHMCRRLSVTLEEGGKEVIPPKPVTTLFTTQLGF